MAPRQLALRFISGKYQGGEHPLGLSPEIVIGRASELDMVLVEDMVSRRHARIVCGEGVIQIEDLGSTNGTFVNGEKISRANLREGDRVLIGTSILKVVAVDPTAPQPRRVEESANRPGQTRSMTGSIEEIPLPDLLQLLGTSKKTGQLVIRSEEDVGKINMRKGVVVHASINDLEHVPTVKCVYRMLTWSQGSFELAPLDDIAAPNEINASVQELLMDGLRQIDELRALENKFPDLSRRAVVPMPLQPRLAKLSAIELDVFQLVWNHEALSAVLDLSPGTDLDTVKALVHLLDAGFLELVG